MTCVWDGLTKGLYNTFRGTIFQQTSAEILVDFLKRNVKKTENVKWNNKYLKDTELVENFERIKSIDPTNIYNGYDCSTCDPVLLLVCELFRINIIHDYNGSYMYYTYISKTNDPSKNITIKFKSNRHHFWYDS